MAEVRNNEQSRRSAENEQLDDSVVATAEASYSALDDIGLVP